MSKKTVNLNKEDIQNLPNNKPVVYKILDKEGENIYTGTATRGNVHNRLEDHLRGGSDVVPGGVKVQIEQKDSIDNAREKEANIINRSKPKYNKQGE